jgi:sugar lactone lactonase YvrE
MQVAPHRSKFVAAVAFLAVAGLLSGAVPAVAGDPSRPALGETKVFAHVAYPGQPVGILVDGDTVWTTPAALNQPDLVDWPVRAYDLKTGREEPDETMIIHRPGPADLALSGIARDAHGRLYVVDMNGRILRTTDARQRAKDRVWEVWATFPSHPADVLYVPSPAADSMPGDIIFDSAGNAYIPDFDFPAIWRVPPEGGRAQPWFVDTRLQGAPFGAFGARLAPSGRDLYFTICESSWPQTASQGAVYRIPIDNPSASQPTEVFHSPASCPNGLAFGASGKLYLSMFLSNEIVVLRPDGTEERRFPSKDDNARREVPYDQPGLLAFDGSGWLLVANQALLPAKPKDWAILKAFVDDTAAPLVQPALP